MENNGEQAKQQEGPKQLPFNMLDQVVADRAIAAALQEQESASTMLETIGSDVEDVGGDDEEEDVESSSSSNEVDENFESQEFYELEFFEDEESDVDEAEEDEIDPDEMSYEELIGLGEIVGNESRGLCIDEIASSLTPYVHKFVECKTIVDRCVICQIDYEKGEHLVALRCQHPFHFQCISQWLQIKKVCPICSIEVTPLNNNKRM